LPSCVARLLCRYRKAALGDERELVVRCSVDAVMHLKGQEQLVSVKALNEFDPKCAWSTDTRHSSVN
jgi:Eukaryotic translation initiation factor 3 subunit 7 (eIF-3)